MSGMSRTNRGTRGAPSSKFNKQYKMCSSVCKQIICYIDMERIGTVLDVGSKVSADVQPSPA